MIPISFTGRVLLIIKSNSNFHLVSHHTDPLPSTGFVQGDDGWPKYTWLSAKVKKR